MASINRVIPTLLNTAILPIIVVGIGEVVEMTGVSARQLRYWESKGIVQSRSNVLCSNRKYDYRNIEKIIFIKELIDQGFTLEAAAKRLEERMAQTGDLLEEASRNGGSAAHGGEEKAGAILNGLGERQVIEGKNYLLVGLAKQMMNSERFKILLPEDRNPCELLAVPVADEDAQDGPGE